MSDMFVCPNCKQEVATSRVLGQLDAPDDAVQVSIDSEKTFFDCLEEKINEFHSMKGFRPSFVILGRKEINSIEYTNIQLYPKGTRIRAAYILMENKNTSSLGNALGVEIFESEKESNFELF